MSPGAGLQGVPRRHSDRYGQRSDNQGQVRSSHLRFLPFEAGRQVRGVPDGVRPASARYRRSHGELRSSRCRRYDGPRPVRLRLDGCPMFCRRAVRLSGQSGSSGCAAWPGRMQRDRRRALINCRQMTATPAPKISHGASTSTSPPVILLPSFAGGTGIAAARHRGCARHAGRSHGHAVRGAQSWQTGVRRAARREDAR